MGLGPRAGVALASLCGLCVSLRAAPVLARPASTGFFAEGGLGALGYLGDARHDSAIGPSIDLRIGHDIFSWLSIGVFVAASTHEATTPPPPTGQYYQLYRGGLDARLGGLVGRIALFVEGGVGAAAISSNVLEKVGITSPGERFTLAIHGGAGAEYQLENRHYAVGLAGDFIALPKFASEQAIDARVFIRYTY